MNLTVRPRRLRGSEALRKMVRETRVDTASLIYPMFVTEGRDKREAIEAMPGQYRYSLDRMGEALDALADAGVNSIMLFGIPEHKDPVGSQAYAPDGIVQRTFEILDARPHFRHEVLWQFSFVNIQRMFHQRRDFQRGIVAGTQLARRFARQPRKRRLSRLVGLGVYQVDRGARFLVPDAPVQKCAPREFPAARQTRAAPQRRIEYAARGNDSAVALEFDDVLACV